MKKPFNKLRASALLIAMVVGVIVSATLFGLVAATNQYLKSAGQSRDGKIAYQAALSGIDDGLLRYKYAAALGKTNLIMRKFDQGTPGNFDPFPLKISDPKSAYYNLSIRADSVSIGLAPFAGSWYSNSSTALREKALPLLADDTLEVDLAYPVNNLDLSSIDLYFSNPFNKTNRTYSTLPISGFFSAVNYQLVNYSAKGEQQIVAEDINKSLSNHMLSIAIPAVSPCRSVGAQCRLRITPRVASKSGVNSNSRLNGKASPADQKYVFLKIVGKSSSTIMAPLAYEPGILVIESIGVFGDAKRKIQVQIDSSTGRYLGMFDFGVYCGDKCVMP